MQCPKNMEVNYMKNPLGIDKNPRFSWDSDKILTSEQAAYEIVVSENVEFCCNELWKSGKINSDKSCNIVYTGPKLKPMTRYYWQVTLWDKDENKASGEIQWFETGLMGNNKSVWSNAQWIGNPRTVTNTSALDSYCFTVNFQVNKGNKAGIVTAARNKDNYILFEIDMDNRLVKVYEYCDNAWLGSRQAGNAPTITLRGNESGYIISKESVAEDKEYSQNNFDLKVTGRDVLLKINGITVIEENELIPANPKNQPRRACLMSVGFKQENSCAIYDNIKVTNNKTGLIINEDDFSSNMGIFSSLGEVSDGKLIVSNRFEIVCPAPAVNVAHNFEISKQVKSARLYAASKGFYYAYINNKKVGQDFFNPGFTDYRLRIQYQTFDVTSMLKDGANAILATVGKGHYSGFCGYSGAMKYGFENSFIGKLVINYTDNTQDIIVTNENWKFTQKGPVTDSDYFNGEYYDARLEFADWSDGKLDTSSWINCGIKPWSDKVIPTNGTLDDNVKFILSAQEGPTAQIVKTLTPISVTENPKGHFVYDFGQNMVGTIRLKVKGKRGTSLKLRFGEMSYKNGEIYIMNIRSAANTDTYILKGDTNGETFIPSYTSHGFRYVEITGNGFELENSDMIISLEGLVLCNVSETTGGFECSNKLINQLQSNIEWGQRGNYLLVPTDCPQRNERMGWTGDAQVFAKTAAFNMNVSAFTKKWLIDVIDGQIMYNKDGAVPDTAPLGGDNRADGCAGWADAGVIVPWEMYQAYGDVSFLEDNYDMMAKWINYQSMDSRQNYGVRKVDGVEVPEKSDMASIPFIQVQQRRGDHLTFDESTPFILSATAYAAYVCKLMVKTATILGKIEDAEKYSKRFEKIKQAFNEAWVKEDGTLGYWGEMSKSNTDINGNVINQTYYSNEKGNPNHPSQTAYALAIDFDLIPEEKLAGAVKGFKQSIDDRNGKLSVGFLGISHLAPALTKVGLDNTAFALLEQEGNPSWLYSVINGATTIWERWNSYIAETGQFGDVSMNSFNHYSYGAIGEWMYGRILGINSSDKAGENGYKKLILTPTFGGSLTYAKGWHKSHYGIVKSEWKLDNNKFIYKCTVPVNSSAEIHLPLKNTQNISIDVSGNNAEYKGIKNNCAVYSVPSGSYKFEVTL